MDRKQYLTAQKEAGRRLMGVFPAQHPREVLWALNILPVEIWDPPVAGGAADSHLQPYICSVVKQGLALALSGGADMVDGFLFPHTCDSIQNLATVVNDYIGLATPCHFFYHPKAPIRSSSRAYYQAQVKALAQELEERYGPMREADLQQAVAWGGQIAGLMAELYQARAAGRLGLTNQEFYALVRRGEWLWPTDFIQELREALDRPRPAEPVGPAVVLSGVLPSPAEILAILDDAGARVGQDDFLAMSRRWLTTYPEPGGDPWQALTQAYFHLPPCSTKGSPLAERLGWLLGLVEGSASRGVIFYVVKFCETELFDLPILSDELKKKGIPSLSLDVEVNQGLSGQIATRVEAFLEMTA